MPIRVEKGAIPWHKECSYWIQIANRSRRAIPKGLAFPKWKRVAGASKGAIEELEGFS